MGKGAEADWDTHTYVSAAGPRGPGVKQLHRALAQAHQGPWGPESNPGPSEMGSWPQGIHMGASGLRAWRRQVEAEQLVSY